MLVKSGCDYRCFSEIHVERQDNTPYIKKKKKSNFELTDSTVIPDKKYSLTTPILIDGNNGQYKITISKRDITEAVAPDPEIYEFVKTFDDK